MKVDDWQKVYLKHMLKRLEYESRLTNTKLRRKKRHKRNVIKCNRLMVFKHQRMIFYGIKEGD